MADSDWWLAGPVLLATGSIVTALIVRRGQLTIHERERDDPHKLYQARLTELKARVEITHEWLKVQTLACGTDNKAELAAAQKAASRQVRDTLTVLSYLTLGQSTDYQPGFETEPDFKLPPVPWNKLPPGKRLFMLVPTSHFPKTNRTGAKYTDIDFLSELVRYERVFDFAVYCFCFAGIFNGLSVKLKWITSEMLLLFLVFTAAMMLRALLLHRRLRLAYTNSGFESAEALEKAKKRVAESHKIPLEISPSLPNSLP